MIAYGRADIYNPYGNTSVTSDYLGVIESSLEKLNARCVNIKKLVREKGTKNRAVVVITALDVLKARLAGYGYVIFWAQGIAPEESFMRHHSRLRTMILSMIEHAALRSADFIFFVSDEMKEHYMEKYKIKFDDFYIMPCFNPKEGLIPRSLLRNKLMTNEVSLGLIPRSLLRGVSLKNWRKKRSGA